MSKYKLMLCFSKNFNLSVLFFLINEANNLIILNYTHNDIKLKERRFFDGYFLTARSIMASPREGEEDGARVYGL